MATVKASGLISYICILTPQRLTCMSLLHWHRFISFYSYAMQVLSHTCYEDAPALIQLIKDFLGHKSPCHCEVFGTVKQDNLNNFWQIIWLLMALLYYHCALQHGWHHLCPVSPKNSTLYYLCSLTIVLPDPTIVCLVLSVFYVGCGFFLHILFYRFHNDRLSIAYCV